MSTETIILKAARALLSKAENWCQHDYAKTKDGYYCGWNSPFATQFCIEGAIYRQGQNLEWEHTDKLIKKLNDRIYEKRHHDAPYSDVTGFNDTSTYEDVIQFLDDCIRTI